MQSKDYASNVFINCPFDGLYVELRNAMIFAIFDCGFIPRCALEEDNGGHVRFDKIKRLIFDSKFGIHDISRTEVDKDSNLPRFNMPLELGVFIGASRYGDTKQKNKNILILDRDPYRYQAFISDIAGQDIRSHNGEQTQLISHVRNWLNTESRRKTIPGGIDIHGRYLRFTNDLPIICKNLNLAVNEVTYNDYCNFVSDWLKLNSRPDATNP